MPEKKRLIVVDISNFIFRAFYAIRPLHAPDGTPVNAVHGVLSMILKLLSQYRPTHIFLAKDGKGGSFRNELYPEYKANRSDPPEDLIPQFSLIGELLDKMGIASLLLENYEADDIIGSAATQWSSHFDEILLATGDKDLMQFVNDKVKLLDTMKDKILGPKEVFEKMGVRPDQIVDYLSIVGDSSDNIPGMKGIGAKGASTLLLQHQTLEKCIEARAEFKGKKLVNAFENHIEDAKLSKKLITIVTDLDLKSKPQDLAYQFYPQEGLYQFMEKLGMLTSIAKLKDLARATDEANGESLNEASGFSSEKFTIEIIENDKDADLLIRSIEESPFISLYGEYQVDDIFQKGLIGLGLSLDGETVFYLPFCHKKFSDAKQLKLIKAIVEREDLEIYAYDPKKEISYFRAQGLEFKAQVFDVAQAHYVIDQSARHTLDTLAMQFLNSQLELRDKKAPPLDTIPTNECAKFLGDRAGYIFLLGDILKLKLEELDLEDIYYKIDGPLISVLADMEREGVSINPGYLNELEKNFTSQLASIEEAVKSEAQEVESIDAINLKSPKQVGQLLFEKLNMPIIKKTKTGASTDSQVLEELDSKGVGPIPGLILKYRELDKLLSTYIKTLPELVNNQSQKIHTSFHQNVAATGRLSSTDPNLQNIPVRTDNGRLVRKAFIARPGNILLSADYSQVELRILAHMSHDPTMIKAFQQDLDIHAQTASEVLGTPIDKVSSEQRSIAKAVNFGLMYGQSSFGLAKTLSISRREAKDYITMYFERFGKVKAFLDSLKDECEKNGHSITMNGRKRFLPDIYSKNRTIKSMAERIAVNSPIQGTAADIIKLAMLDIDREMERQQVKSKMILQVHDELIFEVVEDELSVMKKTVKEKMENAVSLDIPLRVDVRVGVNWYDLK